MLKTWRTLEHLQLDATNPQTLEWLARSLIGHDFLTQMDASNGHQTLGLFGTPHIQLKYGSDMVRPGTPAT